MHSLVVACLLGLAPSQMVADILIQRRATAHELHALQVTCSSAQSWLMPAAGVRGTCSMVNCHSSEMHALPSLTLHQSDTREQCPCTMGFVRASTICFQLTSYFLAPAEHLASNVEQRCNGSDASAFLLCKIPLIMQASGELNPQQEASFVRTA